VLQDLLFSTDKIWPSVASAHVNRSIVATVQLTSTTNSKWCLQTCRYFSRC